jgi:hypothetical protein
VNVSSVRPPRVLDAQDRTSEILFGLIMALSFTGTIEVTTAARDDVRVVVMAALGCNIAWGVIDAVMYVMSQLVYRGREVHSWRRFVAATDDDARRAALAEEVPAAILPLVSSSDLAQLQSVAAERLRTVHVRIQVRDLWGALGVCLLVIVATLLQPIAAERLRTVRVRIQVRDLWGALGVCLLVIVATFPVVLPYYLIQDVPTAKRVSNGVSIAMLFLTGYVLGRFAGGRALWIGLGMVVLGVLLVGVTIALGG